MWVRMMECVAAQAWLVNIASLDPHTRQCWTNKVLVASTTATDVTLLLHSCAHLQLLTGLLCQLCAHRGVSADDRRGG